MELENVYQNIKENAEDERDAEQAIGIVKNQASIRPSAYLTAFGYVQVLMGIVQRLLAGLDSEHYPTQAVRLALNAIYDGLDAHYSTLESYVTTSIDKYDPAFVQHVMNVIRVASDTYIAE